MDAVNQAAVFPAGHNLSPLDKIQQRRQELFTLYREAGVAHPVSGEQCIVRHFSDSRPPVHVGREEIVQDMRTQMATQLWNLKLGPIANGYNTFDEYNRRIPAFPTDNPPLMEGVNFHPVLVEPRGVLEGFLQRMGIACSWFPDSWKKEARERAPYWTWIDVGARLHMSLEAFLLQSVAEPFQQPNSWEAIALVLYYPHLLKGGVSIAFAASEADACVISGAPDDIVMRFGLSSVSQSHTLFPRSFTPKS